MGLASYASITLWAIAVLAIGANAQSMLDRLQHLDPNGDGRATQAEAGHARWFARLDHSSDGAVPVNEPRARGAAASDHSEDRAGEIRDASGNTVVTHRGVRYAESEGVAANLQSLDIYTAEAGKTGQAAAPRPVMIMIHGGGWRTGDKANLSMTQYKVPHFVGNGYVYVSINYRLTARPGDPRHPAHVQDCAKAIAWVHDNIARYGGDPDRIFVMGHSAGAHLAALVSTDQRRLAAEGKTLGINKGVVCLDTAAYDIPRYISQLGGGRGMRRLYENAFGTSEAAWKDPSPRHHVAADKGIPPMLFFHTGRRMAGEQLANELVQALRKAGTPAQAVHAPDRDHAGINRCIGQRGDPYTAVIMEFLAEPQRAGTLAARPAAPYRGP